MRTQLHSFLDKAETLDVSALPERGNGLMALVVPHAGYVYSGPVAAYGYKLLEQNPFDTVVVIGPSHRAAFDYASVYDKGGYRTPLGVVPLDTEFISTLKKYAPSCVMCPRHIKKNIPWRFRYLFSR